MSEPYRRAMALLARREHCRNELEGKLLGKLGQSSREEIGRALDRLESDGHLSDRRFATEFIHSRKDQWGDRKIAYELARRGVGKSLSREVMAETLEEESERAKAALRKKNPGPLPDERKLQDRLRRFLEQRGFDASSIRHAIENHRET